MIHPGNLLFVRGDINRSGVISVSILPHILLSCYEPLMFIGLTDMYKEINIGTHPEHQFRNVLFRQKTGTFVIVSDWELKVFFMKHDKE